MPNRVGPPESMRRVVDFDIDDVPAKKVRGVARSSKEADPAKLSDVSLANELAVLALRGEQNLTPQQQSDMTNGAVAAIEYLLNVDGQRTSAPEGEFDLIPSGALVTELTRRLQANGGTA